MDFTNVGGINLALIAGIIGILFTMKKLDTKEKFGKKFYVVAVLVLGFLAGALLVSRKFQFNFMLVQGIIHAGVASILYQTGKIVVPSADDGFFNGKKKAVKNVRKNKVRAC